MKRATIFSKLNKVKIKNQKSLKKIDFDFVSNKTSAFTRNV